MKQMYMVQYDSDDDPILVCKELDDNGTVTRASVVAAGFALDEAGMLQQIESELE